MNDVANFCYRPEGSNSDAVVTIKVSARAMLHASQLDVSSGAIRGKRGERRMVITVRLDKLHPYGYVLQEFPSPDKGSRQRLQLLAGRIPAWAYDLSDIDLTDPYRGWNYLELALVVKALVWANETWGDAEKFPGRALLPVALRWAREGLEGYEPVELAKVLGKFLESHGLPAGPVPLKQSIAALDDVRRKRLEILGGEECPERDSLLLGGGGNLREHVTRQYAYPKGDPDADLKEVSPSHYDATLMQASCDQLL